ncbi:MAG: hypothetical protein IKJ77_03835 [Firmicutes bacterium]|nr:hypothetical protein [Bacillota bacterium]
MKKITSMMLVFLMAASLYMGPTDVYGQETVSVADVQTQTEAEVVQPETPAEPDTPAVPEEPPVTEEPEKPALKAPVAKTTLRLEDAKPKLTWNKVKGASKYQVYVAEQKKGPYYRKWTTVKTNYSHTKARAGQKYYYKVKAVSGKETVNDSPMSKIVIRTCGQPYIVSITDTKYTYNDFKTDMDRLVKKYPDLLKKRYLGKTVDDRGLYSMTFGNPKAKKQIFVTAGFHAREYINCQVTMRMIEYYCRNYQTETYNGVSYEKLFNQVSFCILPMVNPDGIAISTYGPSAIKDKKLRAKVKKIDRNGSYTNWKANARGVDLNGNYINYAGPPDKTTFASEGYPGPKSYSEKETKAVRKAMAGCSNIKAVINYHSMGNCIYWGYHSKKYKAKAWAFAKLFRDMTGYYTIDESYSPMARGDFEHYIMHEYRIPYVCIENGKSRTPVKHSEFKSIYNKNKLGFAKAAYHYYK